jgi:PHD/YefM family antitoxin component YafN of YafNO toxin-antitoxin module
MKTINNKQLETGKKIVNQLGVNKTAIALTHYNVEKNNIDIRMFLYSDEDITIYTTGRLFLGTYKKEDKKFSFDPATKLPYVVGCNNIKTRREVKDAIKKVLSTHADVLKMSNGYKNLINDVEDVLLYVIKSGIIKGSYLPLEAQLKHNWIMNPDTIIVEGESVAKHEIAVTTDTNTKTEGEVKMNIMSAAHKLRKEMEIEDKEYASYSYKLKMKIALKYAWDTCHINKVVAIKEVAITVDKVININTRRPEPTAKDEVMASKLEPLTAKCDNGKKRIKGETYIVSTPGHVNIEDHIGTVIKAFDISTQILGRKTLAELNVKFTERKFAESRFYRENAHKLIIVTSHKDEYEQIKNPRGFILVK